MPTTIKRNEVTNTKPSNDPLAAEIQRLRAENEAMKAKLSQKASETTTFKVSESGCVSMYGLGRYPTSLRALTKDGLWEGSQWHKVVMASGAPNNGREGVLFKFIQANLETIKANTAAHNAKAENEGKGTSAL